MKKVLSIVMMTFVFSLSNAQPTPGDISGVHSHINPAQGTVSACEKQCDKLRTSGVAYRSCIRECEGKQKVKVQALQLPTLRTSKKPAIAIKQIQQPQDTIGGWFLDIEAEIPAVPVNALKSKTPNNKTKTNKKVAGRK